MNAMGTHDKASAWIVGVAAFLSGLILGFVLPRRPAPPVVEIPPAVAPKIEPAAEERAPVTRLDGPLAYSLESVDASASKEIAPVASLFTAEGLRESAEECGTVKPSGHFGALMRRFAGSEAQVYVFRYGKPSQEPEEFRVTVIPNVPGYRDFDAFKSDFGLCLAGGERYPQAVTPDWLMFVSSCGSGYADGSALPVGCEEVRKAVEPTLQLTPR